MDYSIKNYTVSTNLNYYRVVRSSSFYTEEKEGILNIGLPSSISFCEPTRKIKKVYFKYNGATYRRRSLVDIKIRIFFVEEIVELYKIETDQLLLILAPGNYDLKLLTQDLNCNILELVEGSILEYKEVDILLDKDIEIKGSSNILSYKETTKRYVSDMTSILDSFLSFWDEYAKTQNLTFYNELIAQDYTTKELLLFSYTDYQLEFFRFLPDVRNEIQEYKLPIRFKIQTASIAKFLRLLADIRSLKFMTNIVRVPCVDKAGVSWVIPIRWNPDVSVNSPEDLKADNDVACEIVLTADLTIYNVRDEVYHPIINIIKELGDVKINIR